MGASAIFGKFGKFSKFSKSLAILAMLRSAVVVGDAPVVFGMARLPRL
ncbi:hypothetical protein BIFCAT_00122 [Bifidobacterium catenulatum DSM 16992 = JCM 1194 = LMG 11043]|uniref:Uncharacterized protein n=1 Tax=Bifidobacterium catenulatum DSM 16992 = JCM 1194 = LMG 11043 TaxID=566552 RepID=B6XSB5_9BIFI|nr:hypothetical protein BIFCAT_00122 [Bifidobacterium catenulatum DSM 16992 = JCM 1194 = LMG 11043]